MRRRRKQFEQRYKRQARLPFEIAEPHLYRQAEDFLSPDNPELEGQIELILAVLQTMLSNEQAKVQIILTPTSATLLEGRLHDRIARIISKTFVEMDESAELSDNEALEMIRELLLDYDESIILRNKGKLLRRWTTRRQSKN